MARSTLWKHRKFRALERALGSRCIAAGVLECMWSYGYETAEDVLGKSVEEVEECCGWSGKGFKRGRCFSALLEIGWIDDTPEGYRIHGLFEHCPQYVKRRRDRHLSSHKLAKSYSQVSTPYPTTTTNPSPSPIAPTGACPSDDEELQAKMAIAALLSSPRIQDGGNGDHAEKVRRQAAELKAQVRS